jgi:hypothetical protein
MEGERGEPLKLAWVGITTTAGAPNLILSR